MKVQGRTGRASGAGKSPVRAGRIVFAKPGSFKPHVIPQGMVVVCDTRETVPLFDLHDLPKGLVLTRDTLRDGDYSLRGFEDKVAIERKGGMSDFLNYLTTTRERTRDKMHRFRDFEFVGLLLEVSEAEAYCPQMYSNVSIEVIRQSIVSFEVRFGVHVYYGDRDCCRRKCLDWLICYYNWKKRV